MNRIVFVFIDVTQIMISNQKNKLLHINPGACGISGFHQMSTAIRLEINNGKPQNLEVWEQPKFAQDATV
jgi:hypothetical protein